MNLYKKRYKSSRAARTGNASLDFLPSLIHDYVSIFRKVTAENENLPGPQLVYIGNNNLLTQKMTIIAILKSHDPNGGSSLAKSLQSAL